MSKALAAVRKCIARFCVALLAAMMCGCASVSLTHRIDNAESRGPLGGRYKIDGVDASMMVALRKHAPKEVVFVEWTDPSAVPLKISVLPRGDKKNKTSAVQALPGILTLAILPIVFDTHRGYCVRMESPLGVDEVNFTQIQRDAFSMLPIGFLPCVSSPDSYEYGSAEQEMVIKAAAEGLTTAVAKVVISTLTKARYEACLRKMAEDLHRAKIEAELRKKEQEEYLRRKKLEEDLRKKKQEEELRRKRNADEAKQQELVLQMAESGWSNEAMLRDFALNEASEIWGIIIELRAETSIRKSRLNQLRSTLASFGKDTKYDAELIKSQDEYDVVRAALVQIFRRLEVAYILGSKSNALVESAEARQKAIKAMEECFRVAVEQKKRIFGE